VEEMVDDEFKSFNFWRVPPPPLEPPKPLPPVRPPSRPETSTSRDSL